VTDIRDRRLTLAVSVTELAGELGVHPNSIHRWERRERLPGPQHIVGIARRLALPTQDVAKFFDAARPAPAERPPSVRGHGLRRLRRTAGLTAARIAAAVGVPTSSVYNWEAGRARIPLRHLPPLAGLLGLDPAALHRLLHAAPPRSDDDRRVRSTRGLRGMRHRAGLSQARVAERIGASRRSVGNWERGVAPPLHAMRRLAALYGAPVSAVAEAVGVSGPRWLDRRTWQPGDLPDVLRVLREWTGLTQREVAARVGCSRDAARGWESGRGTPQGRFRGRLEELYGLPGGALLVAYPATRAVAGVVGGRAS
jgi:transcriptional regulator with XRE-family HTH domain